jgi:hypothetical protein
LANCWRAKKISFSGEVDSRAGHNFRCLLESPLSVDPLLNGLTLIFPILNVNLIEERLFLILKMAPVPKVQLSIILYNLTLSTQVVR